MSDSENSDDDDNYIRQVEGTCSERGGNFQIKTGHGGYESLNNDLYS